VTTWIFQGNPKTFDIDDYLATNLSSIRWQVRQYKNEISIGDTVFLWKSGGAKEATSGIVAECRVASAVGSQTSDKDLDPFWIDKSAAIDISSVELLVIRVAKAREVLKYEWLKVDPILRELPILKMARQTNYKVPRRLTLRLRAMWHRTGKDWTWRDSVAGLWAYAQTKGEAVSEQPGSPVAQVAVAVGRAVGGVYNKVMNFRSLDPTDPRKGMSGAGETDREVWKEFFDEKAGQINMTRLEDELKHLGLNLGGTVVPEAEDVPPSQPDANVNLEVLLNRYTKSISSGVFPTRPTVKTESRQTFPRNPLVVEIARARASFKCELPGCKTPTFLGEDGLPYCEVHHIRPLSEGGDDTIENAICLCAVHHREAHFGKEQASLRATMWRVRDKRLALQ